MNRLLFCRGVAALVSLGPAVIVSGCSRSSSDAEASIQVFNAGALALPLRQALDSFAPRNGVTAKQESAGSVESVRKITDLRRIPDVIAVADTALFGTLLEGRLDGPIAVLGGSRLVLAYTDRSRYASEVNAQNWSDVTTRPGVQVGRSDPSLDPAGYRALMAMQLAERHYHQPGLAARLKRAAPDADMRPKSADLTALLQTGNLDYAWEYESVARTLGLRFVALPSEVDLGDPALGAIYATASVDISAPASASASGKARSGLVLHGAPIVFGAAALKNSPDSSVARRFITYLMSAEGRVILASNGLRPPSQAAAADSR
jgi:molybdate/tungstate transport system substrate-binding protein